MSERDQERIAARRAFDRGLEEKARQASCPPDERTPDLARLLDEVNAARAARHRERWGQARRSAPSVLALAALALAALLSWWTFR